MHKQIWWVPVINPNRKSIIFNSPNSYSKYPWIQKFDDIVFGKFIYGISIGIIGWIIIFKGNELLQLFLGEPVVFPSKIVFGSFIFMGGVLICILSLRRLVREHFEERFGLIWYTNSLAVNQNISMNQQSPNLIEVIRKDMKNFILIEDWRGLLFYGLENITEVLNSYFNDILNKWPIQKFVQENIDSIALYFDISNIEDAMNFSSHSLFAKTKNSSYIQTLPFNHQKDSNYALISIAFGKDTYQGQIKKNLEEIEKLLTNLGYLDSFLISLVSNILSSELLIDEKDSTIGIEISKIINLPDNYTQLLYSLQPELNVSYDKMLGDIKNSNQTFNSLRLQIYFVSLISITIVNQKLELSDLKELKYLFRGRFVSTSFNLRKNGDPLRFLRKRNFMEKSALVFLQNEYRKNIPHWISTGLNRLLRDSIGSLSAIKIEYVIASLLRYRKSQFLDLQDLLVHLTDKLKYLRYEIRSEI
ncbi:MAG: hypothetical protein HeimC2_13380 [Candidatus Heimdallarchaeota archaeon LC_2]|nr:MAG: hypothetical protein HeimC2_13380 [Candidatus Heimdallarchaeota archaeon LC_2]